MPASKHLFGGEEVGVMVVGNKTLMPASPKCDMRKSWPKGRLPGVVLLSLKLFCLAFKPTLAYYFI